MRQKGQSIKPPRLANWLLERFCSYDYLSTVLWDLQELFEYNIEKKGRRKAQWLYYREVISVIYFLSLKGNSRYSTNNSAMLKNNIIIALRNFKKHKNYAFLNVIGLSSGLMIFLLITLYTNYEFSYDNHHENADRIFRVYKSINTLDEPYIDAGTPGPLAGTLVNEYPEVEAAARFIEWRKVLMQANEERFVEPSIMVADPSLFDIFRLDLIAGNKQEALAMGPNMAISESIAMKYFGRTDVINETMLLGRGQSMQVTAVFKDMPDNSHFKMNMIINFEWAENSNGSNLANWGNNPFYTYILLKKEAEANSLEAKLPEMRAKFANDPIDDDGQAVTYFLQPLTDVHFADNIIGSLGTTVDANRLYIFNAIALIVLLMAGINYINLATARAMVRIKETGIRKIVGAKRSNLLWQFLIESGLLIFGSLLLAIFLANLLLPAFASFVDRPLSFDFNNANFWFSIVGLGILITLISGIYPALVMSSFNPLHAIMKRGQFSNNGQLRNGLVILQFGLSALLIMSAIVLQRQLSYIDNLDTGYTRDQIMILSTRDDAVDDRLASYMEELRQVPGVAAVATSWSLPTNVTSNTQANWQGITDEERIQMYMLGITHDFFDLYGIEFAEGRPFDPEIKTDRNNIILNESAVKAFGWNDPIGREMINQFGKTGVVVGVVKDFHIKSLRESIEPLQIELNPKYATLAVRIDGDLATTMAGIEEVYESFGPSYPFEYRYFEDIYDRAYSEDKKTGQLTLIFSMLAIIIACLGLYGLASHKMVLRTKELGVRKVMGASALNIAQLLFKEFVLLIGIAFVVTGPLAYFLLNGWLSDYAYHIQINATPFAITLLALLLFAGVTVGYRTFKASVSSPVLSLRDE